jgi:NAD+ synthase
MLDPEIICHQIETFLRRKLHELGRQGILVGISGGLDSAIAATLSVRAIGRDQVRLRYLPDRDSKSLHRQHAQLLAQKLGVVLEIQDITPILEAMGVYQMLPIDAIPGKILREMAVRLGASLLELRTGSSILETRFHPEPESLAAKAVTYGLTKHRLRMLLLYQQAEIHQLMVVGAVNRTEWMTGTFSLWGVDHCADVMPLVHLYRSQLYPLAAFLKLPKAIVKKNADPDFLPGLDNKEALLGSFLEADRILIGLERGIARKDLIESYGEETVNRIERLIILSKTMRETPYGIEMQDS